MRPSRAVRPTALAALLALTLAGCGRGDAAAADPHAGHAAGHAAGASATSAAPGGEPAPAAGAALGDLPGRWRDQQGAERPLVAPAAGGPRRVQVLAMVYTSCTATCPLIAAELRRVAAAVDAAVPGAADRLGLTLVSLDPERDTVGTLAAFARRERLAVPRWTLLTSAAPTPAEREGQVRELAAVLGVRYRRTADGAFDHANVLTVLDTAGVVVHQQLGLGDAATTARVVAGLLR